MTEQKNEAPVADVGAITPAAVTVDTMAARVEADAKAKAPVETPAEKKPDAPAEKATRPEHIPEKFWDAEKGVVNVEAMAKSYAELEKKGAKPEVKPEEKPVVDPNAKPEEPTEVTDAIEAAGLKRDDLTKAFMESGTLSDEQFASLAKAGYDKATVDIYLAGLKSVQGAAAAAEAAQEAEVNEIISVVGTAEQYVSLTKWAAQNLPQADNDAFDRAVSAGDKGQAKLAVEGLLAKYFAKEGREGELVTAGASGGEGGGYANSDEIVAAMSDPRYKTNATYRAEVAAKVGRSSVFGVK